MTKKLLLVRHADTGSQYKERYIGSSDVPASDIGLAQVARLQSHLNVYCPQSWYCSSSNRALQTEKALRRVLHHPRKTHFDTRLREIDFGSWENLSFEEIVTKNPEEVNKWAGMSPDFRFPDGEAYTAFVERLTSMLSLFTADPAEHILVISHGGVIRTMICLLLELEVCNYLLFDVRPASLTVITLLGEKGILTGLNM